MYEWYRYIYTCTCFSSCKLSFFLRNVQTWSIVADPVTRTNFFFKLSSSVFSSLQTIIFNQYSRQKLKLKENSIMFSLVIVLSNCLIILKLFWQKTCEESSQKMFSTTAWEQNYLIQKGSWNELAYYWGSLNKEWRTIF